jgi:hypothetical protein
MKACEAGCMVFDGGETRHHPDCAFYPESLTKVMDELRAENAALKATNDRMHTQLGKATGEIHSLKAECERLRAHFEHCDSSRIVTLVEERDSLRSRVEAMRAVVDAARYLRDSGYDGPFIGEVCAPLFDALVALDKKEQG